MIRVIIADDHCVVREGLKRIIADCPDIEIVHEAADGDETLAIVEHVDAEVLLLDISMAGPGFLQVLRQLKERRPELRVLVLSMHAEEHYAIRALQAGAAGYLSKGRSAEQLAEAIRRVSQGHRYFTQQVAEELALRLVGDGDHPSHDDLSTREHEVFLLLGAGKSVGEIATELGLSPKTVSTYRTHILEKTGFTHNAQIIRYVLERELLEGRS